MEWKPEDLSWADFRGKVLGPTDPAAAPDGAIRKAILDNWEELGLNEPPNKGDNGVHASASPFEGLAEKMNWLEMKISDDPFGAALLEGGIPEDTISAWSKDPRVKLPGGDEASIFDTLEDMDVQECLDEMIRLSKLQTASAK